MVRNRPGAELVVVRNRVGHNSHWSGRQERRPLSPASGMSPGYETSLTVREPSSGGRTFARPALRFSNVPQGGHSELLQRS